MISCTLFISYVCVNIILNKDQKNWKVDKFILPESDKRYFDYNSNVLTIPLLSLQV